MNLMGAARTTEADRRGVHGSARAGHFVRRMVKHGMRAITDRHRAAGTTQNQRVITARWSHCRRTRKSQRLHAPSLIIVGRGHVEGKTGLVQSRKSHA